MKPARRSFRAEARTRADEILASCTTQEAARQRVYNGCMNALNGSDKYEWKVWDEIDAIVLRESYTRYHGK